MRSGILSSVSVIILAFLLPQIAQAGFEFVPQQTNNADAGSAIANPPVESPSPSPADQGMIEAAPMPSPIQSDALPAPVEAPDRFHPAPDNATMPAKAGDLPPLTPVVNDSDALSIEAHPLKTKPAPKNSSVTDYSSPGATMPATSSDTSVSGTIGDVQGFGRHVPLVTALQQIVPPSYRYSFEKPVNPSMKISWTGGKPWKEIIAEIAQSNGLNVDIASNVVSFSAQSTDTMARSPSAAPFPATTANAKLKPLFEQDNAPAGVVAAPSDMNDMIYDGPSASLSKPIDSKPSAKASSSMTKPSAKTTKPSTGRTSLASISDGPVSSGNSINSDSVATGSPTSILPPVAPLENPSAAAPGATAPSAITPAPAEKSAFFDSMMDNGSPANANNKVKDKQITTADDHKPVDILDNVSVAAPTKGSTKTPANLPKPIESMPLPIAPMPGGTNAATPGKQIDNSPVMADDLPAISATPAMAPPVDTTSKAGMTTSQEWLGHKGETLRQTLTAWSEQAGVSLVWSSEYDYPLQTDVRIQSTYADATRTLLAGFSKAQPRPIGRLFKNDKVGAQAVLIIETQRLTN